jgi:peptidoglycan/xylan/chitin deacetylase (PgdA/CDA1 family)
MAVAVGGCASKPKIPDDDFDLLTVPVDTALLTPSSLPSPSGPIAPQVINHGPRTTRRVALTFDACSTTLPSQYDERITRILVAENIRATIFLGGKWMEEHPEHTRYLASLPQFELANHSYLHPHMTRIPREQVHAELQRTQDKLYALTGRYATLFRAPYGEIDRRTVELAAEVGLVTVQFDLASGDADKKVSKRKLVEYVSSMTKNGSIVVMHINRRGWQTADALPEIIARLRKRGFEFVTVSELMGLDIAPPPPIDMAAGSPVATDESAISESRPTESN